MLANPSTFHRKNGHVQEELSTAMLEIEIFRTLFVLGAFSATGSIRPLEMIAVRSILKLSCVGDLHSVSKSSRRGSRPWGNAAADTAGTTRGEYQMLLAEAAAKRRVALRSD